MDETAQKRFLDARQRFNASKSALQAVVYRISAVHSALTNWYGMLVVGHTSVVPPGYTRNDKIHQFDPSRWPRAEEISTAWVECNQSYTELREAYEALGEDDRQYLAISGGWPSP